jgi:hypothetical protein
LIRLFGMCVAEERISQYGKRVQPALQRQNDDHPQRDFEQTLSCMAKPAPDEHRGLFEDVIQIRFIPIVLLQKKYTFIRQH